jgi:hypothetical protein
MQCKNCKYPIFAYSRCCSMCGRAVVTPNYPFTNDKYLPTRLDFWLASVRRYISQSRIRRVESV